MVKMVILPLNKSVGVIPIKISMATLLFLFFTQMENPIF